MKEIRDTRKFHHIRLMGKSLEWTIVCGQIGISKLRTTGNIDDVTCKNCRKISEKRMERIRREVMPRVMKIPWVKEAIKDGAFNDDS